MRVKQEKRVEVKIHLYNHDPHHHNIFQYVLIDFNLVFSVVYMLKKKTCNVLLSTQ